MGTGKKTKLLFCVNVRKGGAECCANFDANQMRKYARQAVGEMREAIAGKIKVKKSGCLDLCSQGPVIEVLPDKIFYTYIDEEDIDEIIQEHLLNGRPVERLIIKRKKNKK